MLNGDEQDFVCEALIRMASSQASPRLAIAVALDNELQAQLNDGTPNVIVMCAIALCIGDRWRLTPPSLVRLMRLAEPFEPRIAPIIERLKIPPGRAEHVPAQPNPFMDSVLVSKIPFLERARIRAGLQALLTPTPLQPFIVVNGPPNTGKSYTADFVSHVLHARNDVVHCRVELPTKEGASVGPVELARDLVVRMGGDLRAEPPRVTNLDRWYGELVNWVIDAGMRANGYVWWVILDGFNKDELRDDTRDFIKKLASSFTNAMPQRRFRLILLDFDRTTLSVQPGMILVDNTTGIAKASVSAFVNAIFADAGGGIDVNSVLDDITKGLGDPVTDLPALGERLRDLIEVAETGA